MKRLGWSVAALVLAAGTWVACGGTGSGTTSPNPAPTQTGGHDGGPPAIDGGPGPVDAGNDGGLVDAGSPDAGMPDAGADAGTDAGTHFGGPGPWPLTNQIYNSSNGIQESPVVGTTTDESQNLWVATNTALYLLQPGSTSFKRFTAADGLHLPANPVRFCDNYNVDGGSNPCTNGGAVAPGIHEIVGGGPNEVLVGYYGNDDDQACDDMGEDPCDPNRHTGKIDRVRIKADGTLDVGFMDLATVGMGMQWWHNRTIMRMVYDHFTHPHNLYVGTNHGVDRLYPDKWRLPRPGEWIDTVNQEWMSDHLHAHVCYHMACQSNSEQGQRMGDWRGLALAPDGNLWTAGGWTAGEIRWFEGTMDWTRGDGSLHFMHAFGDPYSYQSYEQAPGYIDEPVFRPPAEGERVALSAVTVAADGRVWFTSEVQYNGDINYGIAVYDGHQFKVFKPADVGMTEDGVHDVVALPDGRLVFAGSNTGLVFYNPATGAHVAVHAGQGIPDDHVYRLELDTMVSPPALHVSTWGGAAVMRQFPQ